MPDPEVRGLGHVRFEGETIAAEHPDARKLVAYWSAKRSGEELPPRAAIRPGEIVRLLPQVFIAERLDTDWRYRLAGTGIAARLKVDLMGKSLNDVFEPATAERIRQLYDSVVQGREPVSRKGSFLGLGIEHATVENVHLPIVAPDRRTLWIFGGVFFFASVPER